VRRVFPFLLGFAIRFAVGPPSARGAETAWHDPAAECRRELQVEGSGGNGLTATTTLFLDDRFTGFTLFDARGARRPVRLLHREGSRFAIHFDAEPGERLLLYPSSTEPPPQPEGPIRSGLRHLARRYDGRAVATAEQFQSLWAAAPFLGGRFAANVFDAFNPFGPNSNTLHRYEGFLTVTNRGVTQFCTVSSDASFLFVNATPVVSWPGRHPAHEGVDGRHRGSVRLEPGTHRFTYLHANSGAESFAVAAIIPPGGTRHTVIGPEFFSPAAYARVGPLLARDGSRPADFLWENRHMVTLNGRSLHDFAFEAAPAGRGTPPAYAWDFGDNRVGAAGPAAEHLYFAQAEVPVTLRVTSAGNKVSVCRQRVPVAPRYGQDENDDARTLALLERAVRQERETGIQPQGYALITDLLFFFLRESEAADFGGRVLAAADRMPPADRDAALTQLALGVQQAGESYGLAERCFRMLIDKTGEANVRASAALHYGGMLTLCLNRPEEARALLSAIRREDLRDWEPRLLDIYLADAALVLDDVTTALKQLAAIPGARALLSASGIDKKALFDYYGRSFRIENLLRQGRYRESLTEVDMLEWEWPEERASPRINLLKAQALAGNGQPRKAIVCLQRTLQAGLDETYTPRVRLELARLHARQGEILPARRQIARIRKESAWTREEIEARELLHEIERANQEGTHE